MNATSSPTPFDLDAYLIRIGYAGPRAPGLPLLQALHQHHAVAIPFENLDALLGRDVSLSLADLQDKLLQRRRGGYCFEQNLLFLDALRALGFEAEGLSARVLWNTSPEKPPPRTHMLLRVRLPEGDWLADLGFGGMTQSAALRLDNELPQATPHERYRLRPDADGRRILEAEVRREWRALYTFDLQVQQRADYEMANWYISRHPASRFTRELIACRPDAESRHVLHNRLYSRYWLDGRSEQRELDTPQALMRVLEEDFQLPLEDLPELEVALGRLFSN